MKNKKKKDSQNWKIILKVGLFKVAEKHFILIHDSFYRRKELAAFFFGNAVNGNIQLQALDVIKVDALLVYTDLSKANKVKELYIPVCEDYCF